MTKYVLNSGGIKQVPERTREFFAEMMNGLGEEPRMLVCCFALPREDWEAKYAEDKELPYFPEGVRPHLTLATPDTFAEQITEHDIVYLHGGDDHLLQYWLRKYDVPAIWDGKVIASSSAGSNALATHFWTCDWRAPMDGFGILPIKFIPHYESDYGADSLRGPIDWKAAYATLKTYGNTSLPIYALPESDFTVFEV